MAAIAGRFLGSGKMGGSKADVVAPTPFFLEAGW